MKLLHSERLTFREYRDSDVETLIQLLNDKEVSKWTERIPFPYKKKHAEWWVNHRPENNHIYAIVIKITTNPSITNSFFTFSNFGTEFMIFTEKTVRIGTTTSTYL